MKKIATEILWHSTSRLYSARRLLKPLGMRTFKWIGPRPATVLLPGGNTAQFSDIGRSFLAFELYWKGWQYFSPYTILTVRELIRDCGTFFDLGANIGYYSMCVAAERPDMDIVAFEPSAKNFQRLSANVSINRFPIQCVNAAVSNVSGTQLFHIPKSDLSGSLEPGFNPAIARTEPVTTYRLDDYVVHHPIHGRALFKVIIEGHEPKFLRGALKTIDDHRPDFVMAVSRPYDDETLALLRQRGYSFYQITDQGLLPEERLLPASRGRWFFLEHLVTTRPEHEVRAIDRRLRAPFDAIDIEETNTNRPDLEGRGSVW